MPILSKTQRAVLSSLASGAELHWRETGRGPVAYLVLPRGSTQVVRVDTLAALARLRLIEEAARAAEFRTYRITSAGRLAARTTNRAGA